MDGASTYYKSYYTKNLCTDNDIYYHMQHFHSSFNSSVAEHPTYDQTIMGSIPDREILSKNETFIFINVYKVTTVNASVTCTIKWPSYLSDFSATWTGIGPASDSGAVGWKQALFRTWSWNAMTRSRKSYIVNDGELAKPGQRREKPHP